jgi:hypothetical protein
LEKGRGVAGEGRTSHFASKKPTLCLSLPCFWHCGPLGTSVTKCSRCNRFHVVVVSWENGSEWVIVSLVAASVAGWSAGIHFQTGSSPYPPFCPLAADVEIGGAAIEIYSSPGVDGVAKIFDSIPRHSSARRTSVTQTSCTFDRSPNVPASF